MKTLLTITIILSFQFSFGQKPTKISGTILDENGKPVSNAVIHYGKDYTWDDIAYSDKNGKFQVAYPNPQRFWYSFSIEREGYMPNTFYVDLSTKDVVVQNPFVIRSRKSLWYDIKQIDSTHIGITVKQAIKKYKLDISTCVLWDEPPGKYYRFSTEFADSSYVSFTIQGRFSKERLKMTDVLDQKITGISISDTNGNEKIFGRGYAQDNPYFIERKIKTERR